jgi:hypothetical protein
MTNKAPAPTAPRFPLGFERLWILFLRSTCLQVRRVVNQNVMGNRHAKRVLLLLCAVLVLGAGALAFRPGPGVKVYGSLPPGDIFEIRLVHRTSCAKRIGPGWYQKLCPSLIRSLIADALNPMEGIYVQGNGSVTIVYRSAFQLAYDSRGKRRWGLRSYTFAKGPNGWA